MFPESSFSCSYNPSPKQKKGLLERADDFFTFREESRKKLEERKKQEEAIIREETRVACIKERTEFAKHDFRKIDLNEPGKTQSTIGRLGMVRKLLFGMNEDIITSNGIL